LLVLFDRHHQLTANHYDPDEDTANATRKENAVAIAPSSIDRFLCTASGVPLKSHASYNIGSWYMQFLSVIFA
jgi:elongation factor P hydroxylase